MCSILHSGPTPRGRPESPRVSAAEVNKDGEKNATSSGNLTIILCGMGCCYMPDTAGVTESCSFVYNVAEYAAPLSCETTMKSFSRGKEAVILKRVLQASSLRMIVSDG